MEDLRFVRKALEQCGFELTEARGDMLGTVTEIVASKREPLSPLGKLIVSAFPFNSYESVTESEKRYNRECKVIFNDPATILITPDGKKFISKANDEKFDEEKGLLMCIAKDNGVSHIELKKMMARATRSKPTPLPTKARKSLNGKSIKKGGNEKCLSAKKDSKK